jgi:DNA-directed RNA polymerase subunit RPC12/RpoP
VPYVEYDENEAVCPQCGSVFRSPEVLEDHRRESHGAPGGASAPPSRRSVRCSVCGAQLASITALERHNREAHVS